MTDKIEKSDKQLIQDAKDGGYYMEPIEDDTPDYVHCDKHDIRTNKCEDCLQICMEYDLSCSVNHSFQGDYFFEDPPKAVKLNISENW